MRKPPVRLCCGQPHWSAACPDGLIMCCLCFSRVTFEELNITEDGFREDVCLPCALEEDRMKYGSGTESPGVQTECKEQFLPDAS